MKNSLSLSSPDDWLREFAGAPEKIDLGLARCHKLLEALDLKTLPFEVITVAGTNGKGSTVAFLDSILTHAGYLTGRYTSPHLQHFNERIQLSQRAVDDQIIIQAFEKVHTAANDISLSYFEYATLAAILIFAEQGVDVALLEVGLGGRLDAVNAVDANVSIITSIALDHQDWLGDDLNAIAHEKAGIMRENRPCVIAQTNMPESIYAHALSINADLIEFKKDYSFKRPATQDDQFWQWTFGGESLTLPLPALKADIQFQNASAALAALFKSSLWPLNPGSISRGIELVNLAGRSQELFASDRKWLLDVAHNPAAINELLVTLRAISESRSSQKQYSVVFAMLSDKDAQTCINLLKPMIKEWFICPLDTPRTFELDKLYSMLVNEGVAIENIQRTDNVASACRMAQQNSDIRDTILVCGSFHTVGSALDYLELS